MEEKTKQEEIEKGKVEGFFNKLWNSITKIEKYPDMAAEGLPRAILYVSQLIIILAVVLCTGVIYQTSQILREGIEYLQNDFPDFYYKEGTLDVQIENPIIISEKDSIIGQTIIIDTKVEDEITINKYITNLDETGRGIIILKNKLIIKNGSVAGTISYDYRQIFDNMDITEFKKQDVINYVNSTKVISLYSVIILTVLVYSFVMYLTTTLINAVLLSIFGSLASWLARIRMRYVAIFNMSVYALTLSTILNMIYLAINIFTTFSMEYFQVMYVTVAAIYLVAAIFLLKAEFIKKQAELMRLAEAQAMVKKEIEEQEQENQRKEEEKTKKDNSGKKEENKDDNEQEPEGSNA